MKKNYIIIGDSITYGIGSKETGGWANLFKNDILRNDDTKECSSYVHIMGYPGVTSSDIFEKKEKIFESVKSDNCRNVVILSIGLNDTQEIDGKNKVSRMNFLENIVLLMKFFQERADLIILGLTRVDSKDKFFWKPRKFYDNDTIDFYDSLIEKECKILCAEYIPLRDVLTHEDYIDGLHPNDEGHKKIFGVVKEKVESYIKSCDDEMKKDY